jgi:hypothetical protein
VTKLLYVEFREARCFRQVPIDGRDYGLNYNLGTSVQGPILYAQPGPSPAYGWDLQRAGTSLVMSKNGIAYECPWDDVKMALQEPPEVKAEKGAKPGKPAAQ